ncbi:hypothetical protein Hdeb2414_s0193g00829011 [Helianthus debilis subsp. tardiflorus]
MIILFTLLWMMILFTLLWMMIIMLLTNKGKCPSEVASFKPLSNSKKMGSR